MNFGKATCNQGKPEDQHMKTDLANRGPQPSPVKTRSAEPADWLSAHMPDAEHCPD